MKHEFTPRGSHTGHHPCSTADTLGQAIAALQNNGIVVVRTDTIYGLIARMANREAVEKVYRVKQRDPSKQCIVLLADAASVPAHAEHIAHYSADATTPTSLIVPATDEPAWVLRGGDSIAYRVTRNDFLRQVIQAVGPVIAPSANPEALPPARTIAEAQAYFGTAVDCYVDGGEVPETTHASRIIKLDSAGQLTVVRES